MNTDDWSLDPSPEAVAAWLDERLQGTMMSHLGMHFTHVSAERAVAEMKMHPGIHTVTGWVHTGAMVSLADSVATFAVIAATGGSLDPERFPVCVALSSQLVRNVQQGTVRAESVVVHPGRTLSVVQTHVTDDAGRLLALVTTTHFTRA